MTESKTMSKSKHEAATTKDYLAESSMKHVKLQLSIVTCLHAIFDLVNMWLGGVLIGKLLAKASAVSLTTASDTTDTSLMSPFYRVILLQRLSFAAAASLAAGMVVVSVISRCAELHLAARLATIKGRDLRRKVLQRAVGGSTAVEGDWATVASSLVHHVSVVEDVCQNEEPQVMYALFKVSIGFLFSFVVMWQAGAIILAFLFLQEVFGYFIEKRRAPFLEKVEDNRNDVQARLLDTIKNSVMIFTTNMAEEEGRTMHELEVVSDKERATSSQLRLLREAAGIFVAMAPTTIPVVAWLHLSGITDPIKALELGTAVLIVILLASEGHKSIITLECNKDRIRAAKDAESAISVFLGGTPSAISGKDVSEHTEVIELSEPDVETGSSLDCFESTGLSRVTRTSVVGVDELSFKGVTVQYTGRTQPILNNRNIAFKKGKIHGLIGESGSGKSTTMKVAAGLLSPAHGSITHWPEMKIAYVSQDQNLFARTIRENVCYGATTMPSDDDIWIALAMAQIDGFVRTLPNGLDEELTEGESMVSGGQLQRLHLAHLFCVWKSADLVLLDECLSALDEGTRELMIDRLQTFLQGKTAIVITHHSEMLRMCHEVHDMTPKQSRRGLLEMTHKDPSMRSLRSLRSAQSHSARELLQMAQGQSMRSVYSAN
jgi:ABC-type multidrug transport system fused ATPase/permease subunit